MGSTKINAYPYPEDVDAATVPTFMRSAMELMAQGDVMRFANAAERTAVFAALGTNPVAGMLCFLGDVDRYYRYTGSAWTPFGHPPSSAAVTTTQSTASAVYTDLATLGPSVSIVTGTSALLWISTGIYNSGGVSGASFAVSGASTLAPSDDDSIQYPAVAGSRMGITVQVTGLTPGTNAFTMKYKATGGTASFFSRSITAQAV